MTTSLPPDNRYAPGARERQAVRQDFVLDAKLAGFRPSQIAALWNKRCEDRDSPELQVTVRTIQEDVRSILKRIAEQESLKAEQLRELLTMRYESGMMAIQNQVKAGNLRAVEVMIKLNKGVAELHGLTAVPTQVDQSTNNILVLNPSERAKRIEDILSRAAERAETLLSESAIIDLPELSSEES